jgi:urease accessory protein UreH
MNTLNKRLLESLGLSADAAQLVVDHIEDLEAEIADLKQAQVSISVGTEGPLGQRILEANDWTLRHALERIARSADGALAVCGKRALILSNAQQQTKADAP